MTRFYYSKTSTDSKEILRLIKNNNRSKWINREFNTDFFIEETLNGIVYLWDSKESRTHIQQPIPPSIQCILGRLHIIHTLEERHLLPKKILDRIDPKMIFSNDIRKDIKADDIRFQTEGFYINISIDIYTNLQEYYKILKKHLKSIHTEIAVHLKKNCVKVIFSSRDSLIAYCDYWYLNTLHQEIINEETEIHHDNTLLISK